MSQSLCMHVFQAIPGRLRLVAHCPPMGQVTVCGQYDPRPGEAALFSVDSVTMLRCLAMCCCRAGEAESLLVAVRNDAATSPFDVVVKNLAHETKLKNWKAMSPEEKAISKLADVLEQVCDHSVARWRLGCVVWFVKGLHVHELAVANA